MKRSRFAACEQFMKSCMQDTVHDTAHSYRVMYTALRLAKKEKDVNLDVVILSALLHDIGRSQADATPGLKHAAVGAAMAQDYCLQSGWDKATTAHVCRCIETHSCSGSSAPQTLEAKILFDADKLDLTGAVGITRAIQFGAQINEPLYRIGKDGRPLPGKRKEEPSLLREHTRKLRDIHRLFYTKKAVKIAKKRQKITNAYFAALRQEVTSVYARGIKRVGRVLGEE